MDNPEKSVHETPTPELMTAPNCQISGSQRKAEVLKLHKILRKTTNASGLPSKNWPKSPKSMKEWDPLATSASMC
jgi:hypothetical protein